MGKTVLYRLFGLGAIPAKLAEELGAEGVLVRDEGIKGTLTYLKFRAPWRYSNWKRQWFTGAFALTERRFVAFQYGHPVLDVAFDDPRFAGLEFSLEGGDTLAVGLDASVFQADATGRVELRLRSPLAPDLLYRLRQRAA